MRGLILGAIAAFCWLVPSPAQEPDFKSKASAAEATYKELLAGLPREGRRADSARLELKYWHDDSWRFLNPLVRKTVKTRDGQAAEVIFLTAPSRSVPGTDFSMAFLLVGKRVVDWASCWTYNRTATQELLLEDVDGDGFADVAFRASKGWWGLKDKRQHGRPGDERKWLYAYAITAKGFQSLFPNVDRDLNVKLTYDTANQPVRLEARGLPTSFREHQMVECTVSATNTSKQDLAIKPGEWLALEIEKAGYFMNYGPPDERTVLKPAETVSQAVCLYVVGGEGEKDVTLHWKFVPSRPAPDAP